MSLIYADTSSLVNDLHLSIAHGLHTTIFLCSDTTLSQVAAKIGIKLVITA